MSDDFRNNPLMQMQMKMRELQAQMANIKCEGTAGDGAVKIVFTGGIGFESVTIDPELATPENKKKLEEYIMTAAQQAITTVLEEVQLKTQEMHKQLGLP